MIRFVIYIAGMVFALATGNLSLAIAIGIVGLIINCGVAK